MPATEYFENALMPGKAMFRCDRLSASLLVSACAGMWREANGSGHSPERLFGCRQCVVGAGHAGVADANMSPLKGTATCVRCNRTDLRLVGGVMCVSCKNREYEWLKGCNAKGKPPAHHPALERRCVRYLVEGEVRTLSRSKTAGSVELVVELLRDQGKRVLMGKTLGGDMTRQGVLL